MFDEYSKSTERKEQANTVKMYEISKQVVLEAYKEVKANKGSAGVDNQTLAEFEENLKDNLYKIWNRMSSGSYFPPAVRMVEIPKSDGKVRKLGIPTVSDRVAQMVAKIYLEPLLEKHFHEDSYGYRPNKSAHQAIAKTRERCWKYDWVIDLDIKGFFDNLDHELVMRAVEKHTDCNWLLLYTKRWLKASIETTDGQVQERTKGTPQGGVISPLLANLFLHYAIDEWMKRNHPYNPFERYADDIIVHCKTLEEAKSLKEAIDQRLKDCKLEHHPEKTQIVYCKDDNREENFSQNKFDFLGYTFQSRLAKSKWGNYFVSFIPAISKKAVKAINQRIRSWRLQLRSGKSLEKIADEINPVIIGWINYYGKFYKTAIYSIFEGLNRKLAKWAKRKLKCSEKKAIHWIEKVAASKPEIFAHWKIGICHASGQ